MKRKITLLIFLTALVSLGTASNFQISSLDYNDALEENETLEIEASIDKIGTSGLQTVKLMKSGSEVSVQDLQLDDAEEGTVNLNYDIESGDALESPEFKVETANDSKKLAVDIATLEKKFNQGWNYFSLPIATQSNPQIDSVLPEGKIKAVWRFEDGNWESYSPEAPSNAFNSFKGGEGYIVKTDESFTVRPNVENTMDVDEVQNSNPSSEDLQQGWNLIGHYWSQGIGSESSLQSIKENDKGKIYGPESNGLNLQTQRFNSAMFPGEAYWLLVKDNAVYAKDRVSGDDYTVDWSQAPVYQIGEQLDEDDYQARVDRVEGIVDSENSNIRDIEIKAYFENTNISVNESFDGISFENEIVTDSGKTYQLDTNIAGLRKGQSWGDADYIYQSLNKEIPADESPKYLRTKVLSDRGLEGNFIYDISEYLEWRLPPVEKKIGSTGVSVGYRDYLFNDSILEFSSEERQHMDIWRNIDRETLSENTLGEVYIFEPSALASELNVSEDLTPYELVEIVVEKDQGVKDVSEFESATKVCSQNVSENASFECSISDKLDSEKWYSLYWQLERTDKADKVRGTESQVKLVDEKQVGESSIRDNINITVKSITELSKRRDRSRFKINFEIKNNSANNNFNFIGASLLNNEQDGYSTSTERISDRNGQFSMDARLRNYSNDTSLMIGAQNSWNPQSRDSQPIFYDAGPEAITDKLPNLQANITNKNRLGFVTESNLEELEVVNKIDRYDKEKNDEERMKSLLNSSNATVYVSKRSDYYFKAKKDYNEFSEKNVDAYNETAVYKCETDYNTSKKAFSCDISEANLPAGYEYNVFWDISAGEDIVNKQGMDRFNVVKTYDINETAETDDVKVKIEDLSSKIGYDERSEIELTSFLENKNLTHPDGSTETKLTNKLLDAEGEYFGRFYSKYLIHGPSGVKKGKNDTEIGDTSDIDGEVSYLLSYIDRAGAGAKRMTPIFLFETTDNFDLNSSDSEKPELNRFNLSTDKVNITESFNISIEASDNDSGVFKANVILRNIHDVSTEYSLSDFDNGSIEKEVNAPDVETTFTVNLEIFDEAGNKGYWEDVGEIRVK